MATWPEGAIDVVTATSAQQAAERINQAEELAVDVEADAMHAFRARLCFVQVSTGQDIFLFDTLVPEVNPKTLADAFADPARTKFFHAAGGDLQYLAEQGLRVKGLFDTHRAATLLGWQKVGLADLVRERLGVELKKEHQQSDFSLRPLPEAMREYSADDVRYLTEIGQQVREECRAADILEEVLLDCERLTEEAAGRPDVAVEFKAKLPKQQLKPEQYALARVLAARLHALRLVWAEAANVPMGRMLSNAAITALATRPPNDLREMVKREGVRGGFVREHGEEVLALINELRALQARGELPLPEEDKGARDPGRRRRAEALKAWRVEAAKARKVTGSVVLTNPLIDELAATAPKSREALLAMRWLGEKRVRLYAEDLLRIISTA